MCILDAIQGAGISIHTLVVHAVSENSKEQTAANEPAPTTPTAANAHTGENVRSKLQGITQKHPQC